MSAIVLLLAGGVLPFVRRWSQREAEIGARLEQAARLQGLLDHEKAFRASLASAERADAPVRARLFTGATPALAASALQGLVRRYADESGVALDRIDPIANAAPVAGPLQPVPVLLSGQGDVRAIAAMLYALQHGEKLLLVDELRMSARSGFDASGGPLVWSVRLHGSYLAE